MILDIEAIGSALSRRRSGRRFCESETVRKDKVAVIRSGRSKDAIDIQIAGNRRSSIWRIYRHDAIAVYLESRSKPGARGDRKERHGCAGGGGALDRQDSERRRRPYADEWASGESARAIGCAIDGQRRTAGQRGRISFWHSVSNAGVERDVSPPDQACIRIERHIAGLKG